MKNRNYYIWKKSKNRKKTIKQQEKCIKRSKDEVRNAMGLEHKLLSDDAVWSQAMSLLKQIKL